MLFSYVFLFDDQPYSTQHLKEQNHPGRMSSSGLVFLIGTSVRRSSLSVFGWSTGNEVSGRYKHHYIINFFPFFIHFFSVARPFLIEEVLKTKKLILRKLMGVPNYLG